MATTTEYTSFLDTMNSYAVKAKTTSTKAASGGRSDLIKQLAELYKLKKARGGGGSGAFSTLLQSITKLRTEKQRAVATNQALIAKHADVYMKESDKLREKLDYRKAVPGIQAKINQIAKIAEIALSRSEREGKELEGLARRQWPLHVKRVMKDVEKKDLVTQHAVLFALALEAKEAGGVHLEGYKAIADEYFDGRKPEKWMQDKYLSKLHTPKSAVKEAESIISAVDSINDELRSMRLIAHRDYGYPLKEDQEIPPEMMMAAKQGQDDELDSLIKSMTASLVSGAGPTSGNQAQMILGMGLSTSPLVGAQAVGAGARIMRMAIRAEREMVALRRERIAFEEKWGYPPGTRPWRAGETAEEAEREEPLKRVAPEAAATAAEAKTMRQVISGGAAAPGNLFDWAHDQLAYANDLALSDEKEAQDKSIDVAGKALLAMWALPSTAKKDISFGLGFEKESVFDDFLQSNINRINNAKRGYIEVAGTANDMIERLKEVREDPDRRRYGNISDIYIGMLDKVRETYRPGDAEQGEPFVNVVEDLKAFSFNLPEELRGDIGGDVLDATSQFTRYKDAARLKIALDDALQSAIEITPTDSDDQAVTDILRVAEPEDPGSVDVEGPDPARRKYLEGKLSQLDDALNMATRERDAAKHRETAALERIKGLEGQDATVTAQQGAADAVGGDGSFPDQRDVEEAIFGTADFAGYHERIGELEAIQAKMEAIAAEGGVDFKSLASKIANKQARLDELTKQAQDTPHGTRNDVEEAIVILREEIGKLKDTQEMIQITPRWEDAGVEEFLPELSGVDPKGLAAQIASKTEQLEELTSQAKNFPLETQQNVAGAIGDYRKEIGRLEAIRAEIKKIATENGVDPELLASQIAREKNRLEELTNRLEKSARQPGSVPFPGQQDVEEAIGGYRKDVDQANSDKTAADQTILDINKSMSQYQAEMDDHDKKVIQSRRALVDQMISQAINPAEVANLQQVRNRLVGEQ